MNSARDIKSEFFVTDLSYCFKEFQKVCKYKRRQLINCVLCPKKCFSFFLSIETDVTTVHATDKDVTPQNKDLSYFKLAGSDKFTVDPSTGTISITINKELDRETEPQYNLTIIAIDRGSTPLTGTTTVTIYVTDVNDQKPVFSYHEYTASVKENTTSENKMIVKTCNASDNDTDSSLTYTITKVEAQDENGKSVNESLIKVTLNCYFVSFFDVKLGHIYGLYYLY